MIKVSKRFFQPFITSFFCKSYLTKVPSEPGSLKKPLGQQQRHKPYSVKKKSGEEILNEATGGSSSSTLTQLSLGQQKQSGKEMIINLTEQELEVCNILRNVTVYLRETKQIPPVKLRIAGGWVRDKLLQLECHDLDVAIDKLSGFDFANYVNEYREKEGNGQSKIHFIKSNPEKSKHLETAAMNLCGLDIDFVNLRKEVYEVSSRIPTSFEFGTPEEDAHRRDMTINALFYNIHTNEVEDFTKKGISDLKEGLIRTPLSADQTFIDDPLRVLRCIRFASKFHFEIVDDVKNAIKDGSIKSALSEKVSRERIGIEVDKMIKGPDPVCAIDLIVNLGFYDAVFSPPPQTSGNLEDPKICQITAKILRWLLSDESKDYIHPIFHQLDENEKRALYLAVYTLPYKDIVYTEKNKSQSACQYVIRESVKFSNSDVDKVKKLLSSIDLIMNVVGQNNEALVNRGKLGLQLRELGSEWPTNLLLALSNELIPEFEDMDRVREINNKYAKFIKRVYELKLENVYNEKHILDGNEIKNLLGIKSGPIIKEMLNSTMEWQLEHPNSKEECQEFIKHKYGRT